MKKQKVNEETKMVPAVTFLAGSDTIENVSKLFNQPIEMMSNNLSTICCRPEGDPNSYPIFYMNDIYGIVGTMHMEQLQVSNFMDALEKVETLNMSPEDKFTVQSAIVKNYAYSIDSFVSAMTKKMIEAVANNSYSLVDSFVDNFGDTLKNANMVKKNNYVSRRGIETEDTAAIDNSMDALKSFILNSVRLTIKGDYSHRPYYRNMNSDSIKIIVYDFVDSAIRSYRMVDTHLENFVTCDTDNDIALLNGVSDGRCIVFENIVNTMTSSFVNNIVMSLYECIIESVRHEVFSYFKEYIRNDVPLESVMEIATSLLSYLFSKFSITLIAEFVKIINWIPMANLNLLSHDNIALTENTYGIKPADPISGSSIFGSKKRRVYDDEDSSFYSY